MDFVLRSIPGNVQCAYTLCSIAADLRVTQMVDGNKGVHCVLAKSRMPRPTAIGRGHTT